MGVTITKSGGYLAVQWHDCTVEGVGLQQVVDLIIDKFTDDRKVMAELVIAHNALVRRVERLDS